MISKVHELRREFPRAIAALQEALACLEGDQAPLIRAQVLANWGCVDFECGRYSQAEAHWREALQLAGDRLARVRAEVWHNLAVLATVRGELDQAWTLYSQALRLNQQEATPKTALNYCAMGMLRADQERWDEALELFARSLEACRASRYRFYEPTIELNRVEALLGQGNLVEAQQACSRALRGFRRLDDTLGVADALRLYGRLCRLERNWEDARVALERSIELNRRFGETVSLGEAWFELGLLEGETDHAGAALAALRQAEGIFARVEANPDLERVRSAIADLAALAAA
jgi:tetratricopeptide (TPR) repeat protein